MDLRKIKLMELLEESGIAEIEVKEGEESINYQEKCNHYKYASSTNDSTTRANWSSSCNISSE